ncbi:MAG: phage integrase SAM-like domain-containing protein [Planctomycetota bacterium]
MASLTHRSGTGIIQFQLDRKRRTLRLGGCTKAQAQTVKTHVEQLVGAKHTGHVADPKTQTWLRSLSDEFYDRVARVGLAPPRASVKLGEFLDRFQKDLAAEYKPGTIQSWKYGRESLERYFKAGRDLRTITPGDAQAYRSWLIARGYKEATVRRRCAHAKRFLSYAVRLKLIDDNPFADGSVPTASPKGSDKHFVDRTLSLRILQMLPDARWRLIWSLARWGGVRVPSEIAALEWSGVDWSDRRLVIISPKTERYEGGESRTIPMFPEIEPYLRDWWDMAPENEPMVFPGASTKGAAYQTTIKRAIKRAGSEVWPKLWTAVRATRDSELREINPVWADAWIGHSTDVARKFYTRRLIEEDFAKALQNPTQITPDSPRLQPREGHQKTPADPSRPESGVESWPTGT